MISVTTEDLSPHFTDEITVAKLAKWFYGLGAYKPRQDQPYFYDVDPVVGDGEFWKRRDEIRAKIGRTMREGRDTSSIRLTNPIFVIRILFEIFRKIEQVMLTRTSFLKMGEEDTVFVGRDIEPMMAYMAHFHEYTLIIPMLFRRRFIVFRIAH